MRIFARPAIFGAFAGEGFSGILRAWHRQTRRQSSIRTSQRFRRASRTARCLSSSTIRRSDAPILLYGVGDSWSIEEAFEMQAGERLVPFSPNNNLIANEAVLLAFKRPASIDGSEDKQILAEI